MRTPVQHEIGQAGTHSFFVSNVDVSENPTESRTIPITSRGTTDFDGITDAKLQQFFERASSELQKNEMVGRAPFNLTVLQESKLADVSADEAEDDVLCPCYRQGHTRPPEQRAYYQGLPSNADD